jgi:hypothetical protein
MTSSERRQYPRYVTEAGVTIAVEGLKINATMIDISEGGIGIVAEKVIYPGTEVYVAFDTVDDYAIQGVVRWSCMQHVNNKMSYRIGIEAESIILKEEKAIGFPASRELMAVIMTEAIKSKSMAGLGSTATEEDGL